MPSFFEFMDRMIAGKPVFDDSSHKESTPIPQPPSQKEDTPLQSTIQKGNDSTFPRVYIKHTTTRLNGNNMQVYCQIVNTWPEEIMLDKITVLGTVRELDDFLKGGQEREFLVYSGAKPSRQYYEAQLDYKTCKEGDYFQAIHDLTFLYNENDKTYTVNEIRLRSPIRDIYG